MTPGSRLTLREAVTGRADQERSGWAIPTRNGLKAAGLCQLKKISYDLKKLNPWATRITRGEADIVKETTPTKQ